jgi:hypothetical protein
VVSANLAAYLSLFSLGVPYPFGSGRGSNIEGNANLGAPRLLMEKKKVSRVCFGKLPERVDAYAPELQKNLTSGFQRRTTTEKGVNDALVFVSTFV